jgi:hypothetical protein
MCISPCYLDDGTEVACRYCWQCKNNRVNDLVGRCIAESKYSKKTYAITLTYGKEAGVNAVTLVYKDVQIFLKKLRRRYGRIRYICAGEYGTEKGRAHWHIAIFFKDADPEPQNMPQLRFGEKLPPNEYRVDWEPWEHGFSYFQEPQFSGDDFKYLMKYAIKDQDLDSSDRKLSMSKKPPLGHEFFMDLAKTHVEQAVIPRSFKYKIGGVRKNNGKEKVFMMQGQTRDDFMTAFKTGYYKKTKLFEGWIEKYGKEPYSEFHEEWDERNYPETITPEGYEIKVLEMNDGRDISYNRPLFDEEHTEELVKRIHYKPVRYYEPWKSYENESDNGEWVQMNYQGIDLIMWKRDDQDAWLYTQDGQQWRENRKEIIERIEEGSQIKRRQLYDDVLREYLDL